MLNLGWWCKGRKWGKVEGWGYVFEIKLYREEEEF